MLKNAITLLDTIIVLSMLFLLGVATYARNSLYGAPVDMWRDAVKKSPNKARTHFNFGCQLREAGQINMAQQEWERTLELYPRHSKALNQIGNIWFLTANYKKAMEFYSLSVQSEPNNAEANYNLAMTLELSGETQKSLYYYLQFLQKAPPDFDRDILVAVTEKVKAMQHAVKEHE